MSSTADAKAARRRPAERSVLAVRHAPAERRGNPRLDPRRQRHAEPRRCSARASIPPIPTRGAARPVAARRRLGHESSPEEAARRSVYIHVKRSLRVPILASFDGAETDKSCPVRFATAQPTQALGMLNGEFLNAEAAKLAKRLQKEAGDDVRKQVALAPASSPRRASRRDSGRRPRRRADRARCSRKTADAERGAEVLLPDGAESERVRVPRLTVTASCSISAGDLRDAVRCDLERDRTGTSET